MLVLPVDARLAPGGPAVRITHRAFWKATTEAVLGAPAAQALQTTLYMIERFHFADDGVFLTEKF